MNIIKKLILRKKLKMQYQEFLNDLVDVNTYLITNSTPAHKEFDKFYEVWANFGKKYIIDNKEQGLLYDILKNINKKDCRILLTYITNLLKDYNIFIVKYNEALLKTIEALQNTAIKQETRIQTKEYASYTITLEKLVVEALQKLVDIIEIKLLTKE